MANTEYLKRLKTAESYLRSAIPNFPKVAIVLGSGLSESLEAHVKVSKEISFGSIPFFHPTSVEGHSGKMVFGEMAGVPLVCLQGRLHYYEGHTLEEVVFPFRVLGVCGVDIFLLTNAAGGLHADMNPTDLVLISDHINLMGANPLMGQNWEDLGPRFPDMTDTYDPKLRGLLSQAARRCQIPLREGIYVGLHGPSYETPAEIRMYRMLGGDVVGMSTVPEAIALRHMSKRIVGLSFITNLAAGVSEEHLKHSEVIENAKKGYGPFSRLIVEFMKQLGESDATA